MTFPGEIPECVEVLTGRTAKASIIWLHGLGADGYDFVPIVREFAAAQVPAARYVFPHAPLRPVTINGGQVMRAWYDIVGTDLTRREDEAGVRESHQQVQALIDHEVARGVSPDRIVLAGFSQGGAMALHTGLRQAHPLAAVVALSTYLPLAERLSAERALASAVVPVFMAHGTADPVVIPARGTRSRDVLQALGQPVEWREYPIAHTVDGDEIGDLAAFLAGRLA